MTFVVVVWRAQRVFIDLPRACFELSTQCVLSALRWRGTLRAASVFSAPGTLVVGVLMEAFRADRGWLTERRHWNRSPEQIECVLAEWVGANPVSVTEVDKTCVADLQGLLPPPRPKSSPIAPVRRVEDRDPNDFPLFGTELDHARRRESATDELRALRESAAMAENRVETWVVANRVSGLYYLQEVKRFRQVARSKNAVFFANEKAAQAAGYKRWGEPS